MFEEILKKYWGFDTFRPLQKEIIESVCSGKDTVALMPTGGGKSITYQVAALASEGLCVVVTPLISLMKDQVDALHRKKIAALSIHSGMTQREIDIVLDNCVYGDYKFLYISPERIASPVFKHRFSRMNVSIIAVDEAHCISQWGYDFRPSYIQIAELRKLQPEAVVLAVTATATPAVVKDIGEKLLFAEENIIKMSFERKNLSYIKREVEDKRAHLLKVINGVQGCGIVYVRYREECENLASFLNEEGIAAESYHGGMSYHMRNSKQERFMNGSCRVMVATNAFGMGIDKADVRFVVHFSPSDSIESYYQEAGRAGRDGKPSFAVLLYNNRDIQSIKATQKAQFPPIAEIKRLYDLIHSFLSVAYGDGEDCSFDFDVFAFCKQYGLFSSTVLNAIDILNYNGYMTLTEEFENPTRVMFSVNRDDMYRLQIRHKELDNFISLLLRIYTGIFSEFVTIDEEYLARVSGYIVEQINKYFKQLGEQRVIRYIPKKRTPRLTLHVERLPLESLLISHDSYVLRRERSEKRALMMLDYLNSDDRCLSKIMQEYFGETAVETCGKCSWCRSAIKNS